MFKYKMVLVPIPYELSPLFERIDEFNEINRIK